jgi:CHAT domain-containing protein
VDNWRRTIDRRRPVRDETDPAAVLRNRVWEPIVGLLGEAKLVLVSPDGALGKLPFAALPGKDSDRYLIEDFTLITISVPQDLPRLLAAAGRTRVDDDPTLLLVGDVDFDAGMIGPLPTPARWGKLTGTRGEMLTVCDTFEQKYPFPDGQVRVLRGAKATEALFREQAPKHRWLHLATHGFFAPPDRGSGIADAAKRQAAGVEGSGEFHPGVLSGLVMAGANCPPRAGGDDSILTAIEIAELNLNGVDVAVLSACQTGLGAEAGGEGLIGLQRAFQTADARTVVSSLWSVDDTATQRLMERFYENLWNKGLPPAQALRQAQLWMLQEGVKRGMVREDDKEISKTRRTPPFYWAAFALSGDWR